MLRTPHLLCDDWNSESVQQWWCALSAHPEEYRKKITDILQHPYIHVICIGPDWIGTLKDFPWEFNRLLPDFHEAHSYGYIAYTHGLFPAPKEYRQINTMLKTSNMISKNVRGPILLRRIGVVTNECDIVIHKPLPFMRPAKDLQMECKSGEHVGLHVSQTHRFVSIY